MKKSLITFCIAIGLSFFLVSFSGFSSQNTPVKNSEQDEKQKIENLIISYTNSINKADTKLTQSLYPKDGVFVAMDRPSSMGSESILKTYEFVFSQVQLKLTSFNEEIEMEGKMNIL